MPGRNVSKYESIAEKFELFELRTDAILEHVGRRQPVMPESRLRTMMHVQKRAAAGVIASPHDFYRYADPEDIPVGMQVRKKVVRDANTTGGTLECPGGAFLSDQELDHIARTAGMTTRNAPGNLFYQLLYERWMSGEVQPAFTYTRSQSVDKLIQNLRLEITQEMGAQAAKKVRVVRKLNRAPRLTDLTTVSFGDDKNPEFVRRFGERYALKLEQGKSGTQVTGFVQRVAEDVLWADVDSVAEVARSTKPTEEADGMYVYTVGELLALFEQATRGDSLEEQAQSWDGFPIRYPDLMRPRAPSTAWQIRMLLGYVDRAVKDASAPGRARAESVSQS